MTINEAREFLASDSLNSKSITLSVCDLDEFYCDAVEHDERGRYMVCANYAETGSRSAAFNRSLAVFHTPEEADDFMAASSSSNKATTPSDN